VAGLKSRWYVFRYRREPGRRTVTGYDVVDEVG
jgi:hypothetical protein